MQNKGSRLRDLRQLRGMTQKDFAEQLQIPQPFLSAVERGRKPADSTAMKACYVFGVSPKFFTAPPVEYGSGSLNFRTKKIPAYVQDAARVTFAELERNAFAHYSTIPPIDLAYPNLEDRSTALPIEQIEEIAQQTRRTLNLPSDGPVPNVTRALERAGIPVITLENTLVDLSSIDGLSSPTLTAEGRGAIATTEKTDGGRVRFTRAHELGHLVMHTQIRPGSEKVREAEANLFAGAFLMPKTDAEKHLSPHLTLEGYAQVKAKYAVSIQALIRRAKELKIITPERYRSLSIQLSSRGWRTNEPVRIAVERTAEIPTTDEILPAPSPAPDEPKTGKEADVIQLFDTD